MAEKEKKALEAKAEKPAKQDKEKKPSVFKRLGAWFKSLRSESKKISWASWESVRSNSIIVIIAAVICSAVIGLLDYGFSAAIVGLSRLI
ncbi:MAG: preprotein translocase subunit SecE [Ruminococcaceae bacterium]|nr:preprotein translocase subunit SecE [Oscillospiraceae bacterium]